jgi:hypothetical protein
MSFLAELNPFKPIVDKALGIIDKAVTDKDLKMQLTHEIMTMDLTNEMESLKSDVEDRSSARERQAQMRDWTPNILAGIFIGGYLYSLYGVLSGSITIPEGNKEIAYILMGVLTASVTQIMNYFYGSSSGSKKKTSVLNDALNGKG